MLRIATGVFVMKKRSTIADNNVTCTKLLHTLFLSSRKKDTYKTLLLLVNLFWDIFTLQQRLIIRFISQTSMKHIFPFLSDLMKTPDDEKIKYGKYQSWPKADNAFSSVDVNSPEGQFCYLHLITIIIRIFRIIYSATLLSPRYCFYPNFLFLFT
jgi:hypothetical protein